MAGPVFGLPDHVAVVVAMVSVVADLGVVSAQSAAARATAPSDGAPPAVEDAGCFRPLLDVILVFLVTLLGCSFAFWGRFVKVESEAMVIGEVAVRKTKDDDYERKELSSIGCLVLILAEVLPGYDELKYLRGYSGFAMIAIAIQALGYIIAVIFREVKDLPMAPLEVVGLILNIILLIKVSVYSFFNPCHRPLVIYTNSKREEKLLETLATITEPKIPLDRFAKVFSLVPTIVDLCLCGIVVCFIVTLIQVSNIFIVLPLIFFVIATIILIIDFIKLVNFEYGVAWKLTIHWFIVAFFIIVYTWALVVTIVYWKPQHFDARASFLTFIN